MNKKKRGSSSVPDDSKIVWDYSCVGRSVPQLERGDKVLVNYFGRNRVAIVSGKIPGGIYWAQLCAPISGQTRVVVSGHSFQGLAKNA